jgi:FMN phosphatase YigB (HAD superfamily)
MCSSVSHRDPGMHEYRLSQSKLDLHGVTTITFDMWDTIIRRDCHPEEVKASTCQLLQDWLGANLAEIFEDHLVFLRERNAVEAEIASENRRRGLDDEYEIRDVLDRLIARAARRDLSRDERAELAEALARHEREAEVLATRLDTALAGILDATSGMRRLVISDFYMPSRDLSYILARKGVLNQFERVVSSCEILLNKKSGRLFDHVRETYAIDPAEWIHIGDNAHADVAMPKSLNIRAHRHYILAEESRRKQFTESFTRRPFAAGDIDAALDLARSAPAGALATRPAQDGAGAGVSFAVWASRLVSRARRLGVRQVFCTGPGAALQKDLLDASRDWLTGTGRIEAVAVPLRSEALHAVGRTAQPAAGAERSAVAQAEADEIATLKDYLQAHGFPGGRTAIVAELFGDGRLVDAIAAAFPDTQVASFALWRSAGGSGTTDAVLVQTDAPFGTFLDVLNFLFAAPGEDVSGLHRFPDDRAVYPMIDPGAAAAPACTVRAEFRAGVRAGFLETFPLIQRRSLSAREARHLAAGPLRRLLAHPSPELARAWLEVNETGMPPSAGAQTASNLRYRLQNSGWAVDMPAR